MDSLLPELRAVLSDLNPVSARITMWSPVTAAPVDGRELDASYWANNLRDTVLFARVIRELASDRRTLLLEISPHPILVPSIEDEAPGRVWPSMRRDDDPIPALLD